MYIFKEKVLKNPILKGHNYWKLGYARDTFSIVSQWNLSSLSAFEKSNVKALKFS